MSSYADLFLQQQKKLLPPFTPDADTGVQTMENLDPLEDPTLEGTVKDVRNDMKSNLKDFIKKVCEIIDLTKNNYMSAADYSITYAKILAHYLAEEETILSAGIQNPPAVVV